MVFSDNAYSGTDSVYSTYKVSNSRKVRARESQNTPVSAEFKIHDGKFRYSKCKLGESETGLANKGGQRELFGCLAACGNFDFFGQNDYT